MLLLTVLAKLRSAICGAHGTITTSSNAPLLYSPQPAFSNKKYLPDTFTQVGSATMFAALGDEPECHSNLPPSVRILLSIWSFKFIQTAGHTLDTVPPQVGVGGISHFSLTVISTASSSSSFLSTPFPGVESLSGWSDLVTCAALVILPNPVTIALNVNVALPATAIEAALKVATPPAKVTPAPPDT